MLYYMAAGIYYMIYNMGGNGVLYDVLYGERDVLYDIRYG